MGLFLLAHQIFATVLGQSQRDPLASLNYRVISAFFLGWPTFLALQYIITFLYHSRPLDYVLRTFRSNARSPSNTLSEKADSTSSSLHISTHARNSRNLTASLTWAFASASVGYFGTLLAFDSVNGEAACAFVVAWGAVTSQVARSFGFAQLALDLGQLEVSKIEKCGTWLTIIATLALNFVQNAYSVGVLDVTTRAPPGMLTFCHRTYSVAAAITSSFNVAIELYFFARIYSLVVPAFLRAKHRREAMRDIRLGQAMSLLVLDTLTIIPNIELLSITSEVVPFGFGAIIVLFAFNYQILPAAKVETSIFVSSPCLRGRSILEPSPHSSIDFATSNSSTVMNPALARATTPARPRPLVLSRADINPRGISIAISPLNEEHSEREFVATRILALPAIDSTLSVPSARSLVAPVSQRSNLTGLYPSTVMPPVVGAPLRPFRPRVSNGLRAPPRRPPAIALPPTPNALRRLSQNTFGRPKISLITTSLAPPRDGDEHPPSAQSVVYGSDILRRSTQTRVRTDLMRKQTDASTITARSQGTRDGDVDLDFNAVHHHHPPSAYSPVESYYGHEAGYSTDRYRGSGSTYYAPSIDVNRERSRPVTSAFGLDSMDVVHQLPPLSRASSFTLPERASSLKQMESAHVEDGGSR